jgi:succinate-acetate transporter protein
VAAVFGIFGTFWLSYAVLVLGLDHNWFAITVTAVLAVVLVFAALGVYLFFSASQAGTGGKPLPLGRPLMR